MFTTSIRSSSKAGTKIVKQKFLSEITFSYLCITPHNEAGTLFINESTAYDSISLKTTGVQAIVCDLYRRPVSWTTAQ